jgi:cysteine desulfurase/selenocysteine lyase
MSYKIDFPIFSHHPDLVFLDSASTTQKPRCVIDAEMTCYETYYANVHRGVYQLSEQSTAAFERVRRKVANFINAEHTHEIIFTKGTTESINLIAHSFGLSHIKAGDEVIVSAMEHHSNLVPWQWVCEQMGATLKVIPLNESGELDIQAYRDALNSKTKLVAMIHVSNVLGTINPIKKIIEAAHEKNIPVLIDGAQAVGHMPVDVRALDCDFYVFSAHKIYGPTGVGVLYGKTQYLEKMPPYQMGGNMISRVTYEKTTFNDLPYKFEGGTPNIGGVIGFGAAIDYVTHIGFEKIQSHENELFQYAENRLKTIDGLTIHGEAKDKSGVISFTLHCAHPHDIATILDQSHVAVRAGHHCAMPLMDYLNVPALTRASFGIYNEISDIDRLAAGLMQAQEIFA